MSDTEEKYFQVNGFFEFRYFLKYLSILLVNKNTTESQKKKLKLILANKIKK